MGKRDGDASLIIVFTPYCPEEEGEFPMPGLDLGYANNECMCRLKSDDWGFFLEHDLFPTTPKWYRHLELAVKSCPEAGFFTAMRWPGPPEIEWCLPDFGISRKRIDAMTWKDHRGYGQRLESDHWGDLKDVTESEKLPGGDPTAGIFLVSRRVWEEVDGFKSGFKSAQIDYDFHRRVRSAGYSIYLISGLYFYHQKGSLGYGKKIGSESI